MKKMTNSLLMLFVSAFLVFSCGDDESPKNQFTAEGKAYKLSKGSYILSDEAEDDDGNTIYLHYVYLTSGDLEINGGITGSGNLFAFAIISDEDDIAEGTYEFGNGEEAGEITQILIYANIDQEGESYDRVFGGTVEGTIKVSKSGGKHTFKVNFTEFQTADADGPTEDGEGSLKAYFRGKLTEIEVDETLRKAEMKSLFFNK